MYPTEILTLRVDPSFPYKVLMSPYKISINLYGYDKSRLFPVGFVLSPVVYRLGNNKHSSDRKVDEPKNEETRN